MAKYTCERCKVECNTTNEPHLCKDLKKRLERQTKAVKTVSDILMDNFYDEEQYSHGYYEIVALAVVKALSGRDLGVD